MCKYAVNTFEFVDFDRLHYSFTPNAIQSAQSPELAVSVVSFCLFLSITHTPNPQHTLSPSPDSYWQKAPINPSVPVPQSCNPGPDSLRQQPSNLAIYTHILQPDHGSTPTPTHQYGGSQRLRDGTRDLKELDRNLSECISALKE